MFDFSFYRGKKVLITGHTGFKGSWLCCILANLGAEVIGYSLYDEEENCLFDLCGVKDQITHIVGDVRDLDHLKDVFAKYQPEIVIHLAAQPIVRIAYEKPVDTYTTNVMGTVNILECVRLNPCTKSFLNVTTDKVYENKEWDKGYVETDPLDGFDPYSNSKSCSELVTHSYKKSFFAKGLTAISTARAGNVIGGGDFAKDRIIPDCVRAAMDNEPIVVRNPHSTRPYQHVLEPLCAYLLIAMKQYLDKSCEGYYNVGPDDSDSFETCAIVDSFVKYWGNGLKWVDKNDGGPHEASLLKLDCTRIKSAFGWKPKWTLDNAVQKTVEWTKCYIGGGNLRALMDAQIEEYINS